METTGIPSIIISSDVFSVLEVTMRDGNQYYRLYLSIYAGVLEVTMRDGNIPISSP